jgi:hypothetical protein
MLLAQAIVWEWAAQCVDVVVLVWGRGLGGGGGRARGGTGMASRQGMVAALASLQSDCGLPAAWQAVLQPPFQARVQTAAALPLHPLTHSSTTFARAVPAAVPG